MPKRLIDTTASELVRYSKSELLTAIAESEGRTLAAETIGTVRYNPRGETSDRKNGCN